MALAIAEGIRKALKVQRQNEKELHERYFNHISFAKGRDSNGNETGAILCMRKAKRVERELGRVNEAISCLERHLAEIDEYTSKRALHSEIAPLPFLGDIKGRGRVEHSHAGGRGAAPCLL